MSTKSRRARGRPPKTPLSGRTNFLKRPKAFYHGTFGDSHHFDGGIQSSTGAYAGSSSHLTPHSHHHHTGRAGSTASGISMSSSRGARLREAAQKSRSYILQMLEDDDDEHKHSEVEPDKSSDLTDMDNVDEDRCSDDTYEESESIHSEESYSTVGSVSKRRYHSRRPKTPDLDETREIPPLNLPAPATDLMLPIEYLMSALSVYEVLRHFRSILRLSPFLFEDFCSALNSDEQCLLLAEIHITLLKALQREEEANNTTFGAHDLKDSINIALYFLDGMTWTELVRAYLDSDRNQEYKETLEILEKTDFPFVGIEDRLKVLQTLTDLFLATNAVREEIMNEGNIQYDDHCRSCHKRLGDLLCCETCPAVYHLSCVDPPLQEVPEDDWLCSVCKSHQVKGLTDCLSESERSGLLCRHEPIGYDRHGRNYWFLIRRMVVEKDSQSWYYSTKAELEELIDCLDRNEFEAELVMALEDMKEEILKQMNLTEDLTNSAKGSKKSVLEIENAERIAKRVQEEAERKAREEEEIRRREEEKQRQESGGDSQENSQQIVNSQMPSFAQENSIISGHGNNSTEACTSSTFTVPTSTVDGLSTNSLAPTQPKESDPVTSSGTLISSNSLSGSMAPPKPVDSIDDEDKKQAEKSETETRRIVTRSKTGSLTPKQFNDSITSGSLKISRTPNSDDVLLINKEGEVTRVTRSKSSAVNSCSGYFKLGMENNYKSFINQYSSNALALNKHQHNEERDKKRFLSHKFSLTPVSEFKWNGSLYGNRILTISTLRLSITQLESNLPTPFLHPNWAIHRQNWQKAVHMCQNPQDFALALAILEACIKPVLFNPVWTESLGHHRLQKITAMDREEMKKKEKEQRRRKEEEDDPSRLVWIKYPLGLKHQVWKQKGEEYRITGCHGWLWIGSTRVYNIVPMDTVGLRAVSVKLRARKRKLIESNFVRPSKIAKKENEEVSNEGMDVNGQQSESQNSSAINEVKKMEVDGSKIKVEPTEKKEIDLKEESGIRSDPKVEVNTCKDEKRSELPLVSPKKPIQDIEKESETKDKVVTDTTIKDNKMEVDDDPDIKSDDYIRMNQHLFSFPPYTSLPPKIGVDVIDVSDAFQKKMYYPKLVKPFSKLDSLLERRLKCDEMEKKQRQAIEQQIAFKLKLQPANSQVKILTPAAAALLKQEAKNSQENVNVTKQSLTLKYCCYCVSCRLQKAATNETAIKSSCYSPFCRNNKQAVTSNAQPAKTVAVTTPTTLVKTVALTTSTTSVKSVAVTTPTTLAKTVALTTPTTIAKTVALTTPTTIAKTIAVTTPTALAKTVAVTTPTALAKTVAVTMPTALAKTVAVTTPTALAKTVAVTTPTALAKTVAVTTPNTLVKTVAVTTPTALAKTVAVTTPTALAKTVAVTMPTALAKTVAVTTPTALAKTVAITTPTALAKTVAVTTPTTLAKTVAVTTPTTLAKTVAVTPTALAKTVAVTTPTTLAKVVAVTTPTTLAKTVAVTTPTALAKTVAVTTPTTLAKSIAVTTPTTLVKTVAVTMPNTLVKTVTSAAAPAIVLTSTPTSSLIKTVVTAATTASPSTPSISATSSVVTAPASTTATAVSLVATPTAISTTRSTVSPIQTTAVTTPSAPTAITPSPKCTIPVSLAATAVRTIPVTLATSSLPTITLGTTSSTVSAIPISIVSKDSLNNSINNTASLTPTQVAIPGTKVPVAISTATSSPAMVVFTTPTSNSLTKSAPLQTASVDKTPAKPVVVNGKKSDSSTVDHGNEKIDVEGDKENTSKSLLVNSENTTKQLSDGLVGKSLLPAKLSSDISLLQAGGLTIAKATPVTAEQKSTPVRKISTVASNSTVAQLLTAKPAVAPALTPAQIAARQALAAMTVDELKAKMPPIRTTKDKFRLPKFSKIGKRTKMLRKSSLPVCQKFQTPSKSKSIFVLESHELKRLARKGGNMEASGFNYNCKMNNVNWIYQCPRPSFKSAWRYRTQTLKSLAAAGLQLRILWVCLRWDDMSVKTPAGGTNTVSTETEITTTELLKRRDIGPYGLRSEFLVRKIVVPIGLPSQQREKYTPQRSGLRERKRAESPKQTEPSVTETWTPEEQLELWEIKQFGEKLEKQRAALQEKTSQQSSVGASSSPSSSGLPQNAAQIKAQMEMQLKQQRLNLQQKRLLQEAGKANATSSGGSVVSLALGVNSSSAQKSSNTPTIITTPAVIKRVQVQPKTILASPAAAALSNSLSATTASAIRPGVKVQLPGTTITLRPTTNVTLAPKPGTVVSTASGATARLISPGQLQATRATVQIRPQVIAQGMPGQVQNVQIIQGPQGQLQVRGLLPGQQIVRLPDGRLQLITLPTTAPTVATVSTTTTPGQVRPQVTIRPQQQAVLLSTSAAAGATAQPTRLVVPAANTQATVTATTTAPSTTPNVAGTTTTTTITTTVTATTASAAAAATTTTTAAAAATAAATAAAAAATTTAVAASTTTTATVPATTVAVATSTVAATVASTTAPAVTTTPTATAPAVTTSAVVSLSNSKVTQNTNTTTILTTVVSRPAVNTVVPASTTMLTASPLTSRVIAKPIVSVVTSRPGTTTVPIAIMNTGSVGGTSVLTTARPLTALAAGSNAPATTSSTVTHATAAVTATTTTKYALTPQVVQQVVRQALLQNQSPEIQAKLLAYQRQMQAQKSQPITTLQALAAIQGKSKDKIISALPQQLVLKQATSSTSTTIPIVTNTVSTAVETPKAKPKALTPEQKDEQIRLSVCSQAIKNILDKIEREEKVEQKRIKKQECAEEKQKRVIASKLQAVLFKQKEALKKEILRKRSLMEKNLQHDIQMEINECIKKQKKKTVTKAAVAATSPVAARRKDDTLNASVAAPTAPAPVTVSKKKKQKIISTGKSFNPAEKLYCICKTPYDDSKFYIGCDLCSNWFHGACVAVSEEQAQDIESYVCDECKLHRENTSEELYCICRTPYDKSQFYIGCDRCQDWFHGRCVGVTKSEADSMDTYLCPTCKKNEHGDKYSQRVMSDKDYDSLRRLLRSLQANKMAWPFLEPVNRLEAPDYYDVIKEPMDLSTVEERLSSKHYKRLTDFIKDMTKIFDNCRYYNPSDSPFYQCAEVLETFFVQKLKTLKEKF
ncbi:nucleosome-remodeling factor subunit BPTF isoform X3 [Octopus sinensis]|uniref:Nucleosome-remodeling factor subunit BPTF isoform X3 n=1 Tax=Octopus sinensis TaxID=2607531 RepID=A0A6P7SCK6_9MOLL|nr:nucleosome-remodeling factor subunit BPTF isoform X3 [Octopus sinensis]